MHPESRAVDEKQQNPLVEFYLSALAFAGAFILREYSPSPWPETLRVAMVAIAGFAVWALLRFLEWLTNASGESISELCGSPLLLVWFSPSLGALFKGLVFFMFPGLVSSGSNSSRGASV